MFYTIYEELCLEKGISVSAVADKIGINRASVTQWKNNPEVVPTGALLLKISDFFNVSVDYLLGKNENKDGYYSNETDALKVALFGGDGQVTDEMWEEIKKYAQWVKARKEND